MGLSKQESRVGCHFLFHGIFPLRELTHVSCCFCIGKRILYHWVTWETLITDYNILKGREGKPKEGWALKKWCFQAVVLEKTHESPLECKEIKPVNPKWNQPWIFIGRIDAEAPILWSPDAKSWLFGKNLMLGKIESKRRRGQQKRDCCMASPIQWIWVWASSGRRWRTGKPGVIQSMGSQRVGCNWATEQQQGRRWYLIHPLISISQIRCNIWYTTDAQ